MNENETGLVGILFIAIVIMGFFLWQQGKQIDAVNAALTSANNNIESMNEEISQANSDLDNLNGQISAAKSVAWSDYDTMGSMLDSMQVVEDHFDTYDIVSSSTN